MVDPQPYIDVVDRAISERPRTVVAAFLLVTVIFFMGMGGSGTESGTEQFTEDIPAQEAQTEIIDRFETERFGDDAGSTQLIQRDGNVLSKRSMARMLRAQHRLEQRERLRVSGASSIARDVARTIDPSATTLEDQLRAMERAPASRVRRAVRTTVTGNGSAIFRAQLSRDFNPSSLTASATIGSVTHRLTQDLSQGAGQSGTSPLTSIQREAERVVGTVGGDIVVFGNGILSAEFNRVIGDSLAIVVPAAVVLILFFLILAYRDPVDLVLGMVSLVMAIVWTFGFMGLAGIAFTQMLIAIPPLLLAVGIDFGIHAINRYREERVQGFGIVDSMKVTTDQLLIAFGIVTGTTVIGFSANLTSSLGPVRDFGLVAAVGIVFTFLIFGIFLPAAKVWADRAREGSRIPEFGSTPLGSEGSALSRVLRVGVGIARRGPTVFLVVVAVSSVGLGYYGTDVGTEFTFEQFLPPEDTPAFLDTLPEPFRPSEYTVTATTNYLEDTFATGEDDQVTVFIEGPLRRDSALESIYRAGLDPPDTFIEDGRAAEQTGIVQVIRSYADRSPRFARLVRRNDLNGNGVPDDDLGTIYDRLLASPLEDRALNYITDDYGSTRVVYSVESDASQAAITEDAETVGDRHRMEATATGTVVVLKAVSDVIATSAFRSMAIAMAITALFLVLVYGALEGRPGLGVVNLVPIAITLALIAATMRALDVPFNAITGTVLSIAIGLGVDYSAHMVHRFSDEFGEHELFEALDRTVRGTGGALTGSMLTTVTGIGVLVLAITPLLGQFGLLIGVSILYSYLTSLLVLPSALTLWSRHAPGAG